MYLHQLIAFTMFPLLRDCRQGNLSSSNLFIITAENLVVLFKNDENIKHIKIHNTEFLFSQFADDPTILLVGLSHTLNLLNLFASISRYPHKHI